MPDIAGEFAEWLEEEDRQTLGERAERAAWVAKFGWPESGYMLYGGLGSLAPWDDTRRAFVNGEFLATILLGQAFLEQTLAGYLDFATGGGSGRRLGFAEILGDFRLRGWITDLDFEVLDRVRRLSNPYAHYRGLHHKDNLMRRVMNEGEEHEVMIERDARSVLRALLRLLNRPPFAMGPIIYPREDGWAVTPDQMTLPL